MKPRILFFVFMCVWTIKTIQAQSITSYSLLTTSPQQYTKVEFDIAVSAAFSNPYNIPDISLDLIATSPSGKTIVQPCYYVSGTSAASSWKGRFAPKESGSYTYNFRLNKSNAQVAVSSSSQFTAAATSKDGFLHSNNNWTFKFDSGKPFRAVGENYAWEPRSYETQKYKYEYMIPRLAATGSNFFRTWMCPWNLPLEWKKPTPTNLYSNSTDYFNPSAIKRIDELIALLETNNMYIMLTLNTFGDLDGEWNVNSYNKANGGPANTPNEFFSLTASKDMFKNRLRYMVARWGYSPNLAVFEFFNEIDNAVYGLNLNQADVTQWHNEMSQYLSNIDPNDHLISTSVSDRDITGLNSVPAFDFNQRHIYSDPQVGDVITTIPASIRNYVSSTGKPYVIGEYGYDWRGPVPSQGAANDDNYKRGLWYGIFSPTPIAPMSWWWEMFDDRNTITYLSKVQDISNKMLAASSGTMSEVTVNGNGSFAKYGVRCGSSYFIYGRNNSGGTINTDFSIALTGASCNVTIYNTTTGGYADQGTKTTSGGTLVLPSVSLPGGTDVIMIVSPANPVIQAPYGGTAWPIPGTIQAESYDTGGEAVAYHDNTTGNTFNVFRTDDVDVEVCADAGTGYDVGDVSAGEWLEYSVNVATTGMYNLMVRVASINTGKTFHIEINGVNISGTIVVPNSGGWQTWQTVTVNNVSLTAGSKIMRIAFDTDLFNLNYVSFAASQAIPVITSAGTAGAAANTAFSYTITGTNNPTGFAATGLPTGLTLNASTGLISGQTAAGTYTITLTATNAGGTSTGKTLTLTVTVPVVAPVISNGGTASATVESAFTYSIIASGNPTSYAATGLPDDLTINTSTGVISGTPMTSGSFVVTLTASNAGGSVTTSLTITVGPQISTGINDPLEQDIAVYPNPVQTSGTLTVQFSDQAEGLYEIHVYNYLGQSVFETLASVQNGHSMHAIDLPQQIATGYYQLEIVSPSGQRSIQKIVVQ